MKNVVVFFLLFGLINFALGDDHDRRAVFDHPEAEDPCQGRIVVLTERGAGARLGYE